MTFPPGLPAPLHAPFPAGVSDRLALAGPLPSGRLLGSDEGDDRTPVMWMSEGPAPTGLWESLHRERHGSGLWPLLLASLGNESDFRPWGSEELYPDQMTSIEAHDVDALLHDWWQGVAECRSDDPEEAAERRAATAPFGPAWPGRAPSPAPASDPGVHASRLAARLLSERPTLRIGLVPAACGAEALVACGWSGPMNHENDTATIAAVLHGWERRFGVRVVAAGFDTLDLAVAAPPTDLDGALLVAAEHLALCPDNILQGTGSLAEYAEHLIAADTWTLWWD